jgi:hypothetical protein
MTFIVKRGKYLIEKTRRNTVGVVALVGTGGSVPKLVQDAVNGYARHLGRSGSDEEEERKTIRAGMKQMQGTWLVLSPSGLRWASASGKVDEDKKSIKTALRNSGWSPPSEQLDELLAENS